MKKHLRTAVALIVVALTVLAFVYYVKKNPDTITQLGKVPPFIIIVLLCIYAASFLAYVLITRFSLEIFSKTFSRQENLLFNAYSSLINFFGPGQSGPAFRAIYLKRRHNLTIKRYAITGLIYYGFFGVISLAMVFGGSRPWWQTIGVAVAAAVASVVVVRRYKAKLGAIAQMNTKLITWIGLATAAQIVMQIVIFAIELRSVGDHASWAQIATYTGVANLALFVSFTPGGIGIRESFLLFSERLHHIDSTTVVAASILDRSVYLVFLGILFVLVVSLHAKDKLHIKQPPEEKE